MAIAITDELMTSDRTSHVARFSPDGQGAWVVSWLPLRLLDRNEAITAMTFAESVNDPWAEHLLAGWAAELHIDLDRAIREAKKGAAPCATPTPAGEPSVCTPEQVGGSGAHPTNPTVRRNMTDDGYGRIDRAWCRRTGFDLSSNVPWGLKTCKHCLRAMARGDA